MLIHTVSDFRRAVRNGPFAWPGGYDTFAITHDGAALCYDCMDKERRLIADAIGNNLNDGWRVVAIDATCNTDSEVVCDHCGAVIAEDFER